MCNFTHYVEIRFANNLILQHTVKNIIFIIVLFYEVKILFCFIIMACSDNEQCSISRVERKKYKTEADQSQTSQNIRDWIRCHEGKKSNTFS